MAQNHMENLHDRVSALEIKMEENNKTTWRIFEAIYGNGKPGLLSDVRSIRESMEGHHKEVEEKSHEKKADWKWIITTTLSLIASLSAIIVAITS